MLVPGKDSLDLRYLKIIVYAMCKSNSFSGVHLTIRNGSRGTVEIVSILGEAMRLPVRP